MFKTKIQELCQKRSWSLPEYKTNREGPVHNSSFSSTVTVNGLQFHSPEPTRTAKEAQNNAAKLAFDHFSQPISLPQLPSLPGCSFPQPSLSVPLGSPGPTNSGDDGSVLQPSQTSQISSTVTATVTAEHKKGSPGPTNGGDDGSVLQPSQTSQIGSTVTASVTAEHKKDMLHLFKNQLQNYAQKRKLNLPVYYPEWEGPAHALRFKCKVTVDGQTFESPKFFSTLKDAEHAAAEVALMSLSSGGAQEDQPGLYKNLLQELVHKEGPRLPSYNTTINGEAHMPIFVSQVEIEGEIFTGQEAKSKKQAEINAAKVAYMTLKERKGMSDQSSLFPLSAHQGQAPDFSSDCSEANVVDGLQHHANLKSPVSLGFVIEKQPGKDKEPAIVTERKQSSSAGNTNGCTEKSSFSSVQSSHSLSDSTNVNSDNSNMPSGEVSIPSQRKKVVVYSRNTNVEIEVGGTLMPISDEKWVAYSYSH